LLCYECPDITEYKSYLNFLPTPLDRSVKYDPEMLSTKWWTSVKLVFIHSFLHSFIQTVTITLNQYMIIYEQIIAISFLLYSFIHSFIHTLDYLPFVFQYNCIHVYSLPYFYSVVSVCFLLMCFNLLVFLFFFHNEDVDIWGCRHLRMSTFVNL